MQLFAVSPLLIYPLWRRPKTGLVLLASATLASLAAIAAAHVAYGLAPYVAYSGLRMGQLDYNRQDVKCAASVREMATLSLFPVGARVFKAACP